MELGKKINPEDDFFKHPFMESFKDLNGYDLYLDVLESEGFLLQPYPFDKLDRFVTELPPDVIKSLELIEPKELYNDIQKLKPKVKYINEIGIEEIKRHVVLYSGYKYIEEVE